ncbi:BnaC04g21640D [Brassica napus]|uniref:RING-type E3 ubiquitin transferase n=1 Tax=Brassica napus TaxID=3708 RepID=A0A078I2A5_BRANA|nr:BnaC04g21640D [Brassica napus]
MTFSKQVSIFMFLFCFPLLNAPAAKRCYNSSCGNRNVDVRFLFWLFPKQSSTCGHTRFNILCTDRHETALKLPNTELFLVRDIDSEKQLIRLNDPNNRMARRLLSFDASGSPFSPLHLLNHTILTCPNEDIKSSSPYTPIICLVAVHLNDQDLWLKWDSPSGRDCEGSRSLGGFKNNTTLEVKWFSSFKSGLYNFILLILKLIYLSLMTLLFGITTCVVYVTFMKVEKNMKLPGKNNNICSICLSEYASSETVGCLLICEHCFHVECIDTWLQLRSSCPICRNSFSIR